MTSPPSIPPRPTRSKDEPDPSTVPAIPPRPKRSKSPLPVESSAPETPPEPAVTTISPSTELRAPQARVPVRPPVRKNTGIPQIGSRVPMYPNAGDVQAPAPSATPGGGKKSHVYREEWEMDEGAYGSKGTPRVNPYTRSSSDLNQSVAQGLSAPETSTPVPDEEIGYLASEHFARVISPQHTGTPTEEQETSLSQVISHSSTPGDDKAKVAIHLDPPTYHHHLHNHHPHRVPSSRPGTRPSTRPASPTKHYDEDEDDGNDTETEREHEHPILASDEVLKRAGQGFMLPAVSPPLAAWRPGSTANSRPQSVHPGSLDDEDDDVELTRLSTHGSESHESLILSSLESGERPEPLFPDSDPEDQPTGTKTPAENKPHEKLKRPGMPESTSSSGGHKFPSKDVWEEAPEFSQLEATVHTRPPSETEMTDEDHEAERTVPKRTDGKNPAGVPYIQGQPNEHYVPGDEVEFERKQKDSLKKPAQYQHQIDSSNRDDGLDRLLKRGNSTDDPEKLGASGRAKAKRFPSNDIWEDVPPSLELSASIGEEDIVVTEPKDRATTGGSIDPADTEEEKRPTTGAPIEGPASPATTSKPDLPARPVVPAARPQPKARQPADAPATEKKLPPGVPDRPKPKVPLTRPSRPSPVARTPSVDSPPPPAAKPKPTIPPRTGGKIAALKAGFLSDLDNRLKLGPMAPKKEEVEKEPKKEEEKVVLGDVRKGRAKGPRGRKLPTTAEKTEKPAVVEQVLSVGVWAVWSVGGEGDVEVISISGLEGKKKTDEVKDVKEVPVPTTSTLPGVTGTGVQSVPSIPADTKVEETPTPPSAAEEKEEKEEKGQLPTLLPSEEHPEDAIPAAEEKGIPDETATERGRVDDVAEVGVAGGEVANMEGDERVEI